MPDRVSFLSLRREKVSKLSNWQQGEARCVSMFFATRQEQVVQVLQNPSEVCD